MPVPRLAIVGRPNVGKSSLLNMLARDKVSIVDPTAGTTRDRVSVIVELPPPGQGDDSPDTITAEVTDTGGYGVYVVEGRRFDEVGADLSNLTGDIEFQISQAVETSDLVLFVVDAQAGITAHDETIARLLRERVLGKRGVQKGKGQGATKSRKGKKASSSAADAASNGEAAGAETAEPPAPAHNIKVLIVANKCDGPRWEAHAMEAAALGFGEPLPVSAKNNYFRRDFLDHLYEEVAAIPHAQTHAEMARADDPAITGLKLAIIGKRNAGKSSLVNALAGQDRVIVSEIAGTTRDAVDVRFEVETDQGKQVFTAIDTAGLRKKKSFADRIEWWAYDRAVRAIERADVCMLLLDATLPVSQVDEQLAQIVKASYKPAIIVVNKWDLVEGKPATAGKNKGKAITPRLYEEYLRAELKGLDIAPIVFVSAAKKFNLPALLSMAQELHEQARTRVGTGQLNRLLRHILSTRGPSSKLGTFAKAFYIAQVATNPPTIVIVVNRPELFNINYQKFLLNSIRREVPFSEVPIKLVIKERKKARLEDLQKGVDQEVYERRGMKARGVPLKPTAEEEGDSGDAFVEGAMSAAEEAALLAEFERPAKVNLLKEAGLDEPADEGNDRDDSDTRADDDSGGFEIDEDEDADTASDEEPEIRDDGEIVVPRKSAKKAPARSGASRKGSFGKSAKSDGRSRKRSR